MPGGVIPESCIPDLIKIKPTEIHMAIYKDVASQMKYKNPDVFMGGDFGREFVLKVVDGDRVRKVVDMLS
jgi:copper homeostasis protein CutC